MPKQNRRILLAVALLLLPALGLAFWQGQEPSFSLQSRSQEESLQASSGQLFKARPVLRPAPSPKAPSQVLPSKVSTRPLPGSPTKIKSPEIIPSVCGNGQLQAGEQCDDGNLNPGDGCSELCQNEPGQVIPFDSVNASLQSYVSTLKGKIIPKDTNEYLSPVLGSLQEPGDREHFKAALDLLEAGQIQPSLAGLEPLGYKLVELNVSDSESYWVVEEAQLEGGFNAKGWGTVIFNPSASRPKLSIQVPHALADLSTLDLGRELFESLDAGVLMINGAHRNANAAPSPFDPDYRESDAAHAQGIFYGMTQAFADSAQDIALQVHGFTYASHPDFLDEDPEVGIVLSKGSTSSTHPLQVQAAQRLGLAGFGVAVCGAGGWGQLCGTQNAGGDYINDSNLSRGTFLHMELSNVIREGGGQAFPKITQALDQILP